MRRVVLFWKYLIQLGPVNLFDYLFQRYLQKKEILSIKHPKLKFRIALRNFTADVALFAEIFIFKEYNVDGEGEVKTIIDCGANIGLASLYFLSKYPGARIIALEPEAENYKLLQRNLTNYPNVTCLKKGIWNKSSLLKVTNTEKGNLAFMVEETTEDTIHTIEGISVADLMKEYGIKRIDILKVDVEGSEEQVFLSNVDWLPKVGMIFCEIHESLKPGLVKKITSVFDSGYEVFMHGEYHVFKKK